MLDFCDEPYCFFEPKPNRLVMALSRMVNRLVSLQNPNHRIAELELSGQVDQLRELVAQSGGGARILFVANHSTHSDPQVMTEVLRQVGARTHFMAAYDVFLRSKLNAWVMQSNGAFSVDREGSDSRAMKTAVRMLAEAPHGCGLTIFPEGNVYLTNERVTPFLDGASFIALKAQKSCGDDRPVYVVPLALCFTHTEDVRDGICERMRMLAAEVESDFELTADPVLEMQRIGQLLLLKNLRQRGLLLDEAMPLADQLARAVQEILEGLEKKLALKTRTGTEPVDRVRAVRARLHQLRTDTKKAADFSETHIEAWADEAILAFRIIHYSTPYLVSVPTVDRFAEVSERLMEDHFSEAYPPLGPRRVAVQIAEPLDLRDCMDGFAKKSRQAIGDLSLELERRVQAALDEEHGRKQSVGSEIFGSGCKQRRAALEKNAQGAA